MHVNTIERHQMRPNTTPVSPHCKLKFLEAKMGFYADALCEFHMLLFNVVEKEII